ncbi:endonuclease domain-containing protein [Antarcticibacterium sp. 1MA-6-2]|uniref:endonuclease domain-containing protein n=1 Tax=Antarcticibacterium sp. 1MA-6-2 TaxID=2908210 RepID=UPI001F33CA02|nr:endonuclease domain-containing protein [Antarcticibacterium sp. 1MA-6-2]UJH91758.1 endonuclease domain-containing protein [Antarcticibacterium sp. 1MA-6-2]
MALRKAGNLPEVIFWKQVHRRKFYKIDFDRQKIIGNYIVDFYVKSLSLIIEIDGSSHKGKELYDARREKYLLKLGLKIFRIPTTRIKFDIHNVMRELEEFIIKHYS